MLNKTKKTSFQWRHPCICILIHVDHGQRPITARVVFTSLYKGMSTIKLNTDCVCLGHLANNTRSLLNNWNTFHVAVGLFSNRSEKTSKCGLKKINKKWHTSRRRVCHWCFYHILTSSVWFSNRTERQLTTARANQTTGLTNDCAANWAPEVEFSPFCALSRRQMTFPFCC